MKQRCYYSDSYTTQFTAQVLAASNHEDRPSVVLAQTYFYPSSGGQPFDSGRIGDAAVIDVTVREADQAIVHWLDQPLDVGDYAAEVDWQRRFDHMQQHTGQHILSRACIELADATTIGFHLGLDSVTIDLDLGQLSAEKRHTIEQRANQIVWENRPISTYTVSKADAAQLPLRKRPAVVGETLRIVEIRDFDLNACGGTHVRHTGEVGIIKIVKVERVRKKVRVEFRCGGRALTDYERKNEWVRTTSAELACATSDLVPTIQRLRSDLKQTHKQLKTQSRLLLKHEAAQLVANATILGNNKLITQAYSERNPHEIRQLVNQLVQNAGTIVLMGIASSNAQLIFGRSKDAPGAMNELLQAALEPFGASGGGSVHHAQGGGFSADSTIIKAILADAEKRMKVVES